MAKVKYKKKGQKVIKNDKIWKSDPVSYQNFQSFNDGKVLTCLWDVWISGEQLSVEKRTLIQSIEITETVDGSDTAVIEISDPEYEYIEDNIYIEANRIHIQMGWNGYEQSIVFDGYISHLDISFPSDGIPKLTLTCMDKTYRMNRKNKSATYKNTTSAKIVKKICKKYGFKCKIQKKYDFKKQDYTQSNQTDIEFIQQLAQDEVYPFTARLVGDTFYYKRKGKLKKNADCELHYVEFPHDIISFDPKINKVSKEEVSAGSTDIESKSSEETLVKEEYDGEPTVSAGGSSSTSSSGGSSSSSGGSSSGGTGNSTKQEASDTGSGRTVRYDKHQRQWIT